MEIKTEQFKELARKELGNERHRHFLKVIPPIMRMKREAGYDTLPDIPAAMAYGAAIRGEAIARLPELLEEFERNATANGMKVVWARDGKEANDFIVKLAKERGIRYVTKGKSMVTEETSLNEMLEESGVEVWETDLGEFIAQQLHRPPFHIVGPAINVPVEEVRDLFSDSLATHQNLTQEMGVHKQFEALERELDPWLPQMECGSMDRLAEVRPQFAQLKEQFRKTRKFWKRQGAMSLFKGLLVPGRIFRSNRGTPYMAVAEPDMEHRTVEAVRLGFPLRFRKGRIRSFRVGFHRIRGFCQVLHIMPPLEEREVWRDLAMKLAAPRSRAEGEGEEASSDLGRPVDLGVLKPKEQSADELNRLASQLDALPCRRCALYGPCQKSTSHPFAEFLQRYFEQHARIKTIRDRLWWDFLKHYRFLQAEGYIDEEGHLTEDGLWASKLRLDQPILISECIRKGIFPEDEPEVLAALIAPFVMDRDRPGDQQLSSLIWRHQNVAAPFFKMLQSLKALREHLQNEGFGTPPMPFWTVVTLYYWARGTTWEELHQISGMDEGDLAMVILRTADHLRQIEALSDTHPRLSASARNAIDRILREPVLV